MPTAPLLQPTRLPSITEPIKPSWKLSFASEQRGEHLRKLSQKHAVPLTLNIERLDDSTQPLRYLHDKGLRTSSQVVTASEDDMNLEYLASHAHTCSASVDFGGVDGVGDGSTAIHLHEMGISRRLASRVQISSSPHLSSQGSQERGVSSSGGASNIMHAERKRYLQNTSDSIPLSERIPQSWGQIIHANTSSVYLPTGYSLQPSRESSQFIIPSLDGGRNKMDADDFRGKHSIPLVCC
jgi:hypothetical protein